MIHLHVGPDHALLRDDGGYHRRVEGSFPATSCLDSSETPEIIHWLSRHPAIFRENEGKPVGCTSTELPLFITPFPADEEVAFCVCVEGDPTRRIGGVGLCSSPAETMARFADYQAALNGGSEAFFARIPAMVLEARHPDPTPLPQDDYPIPTCTAWVAIHAPHTVPSKLSVRCHEAGDWQIGCPAGQSRWILACKGRQVLDDIPPHEAGYWAEKLAHTAAPAEAEKQDELIGSLLREKRRITDLDAEPVTATASPSVPSAPRVSLSLDRGPELGSSPQQR